MQTHAQSRPEAGFTQRARRERRARRGVDATDPRQTILEAAERLCGKQGLEAVSVRDIAAEAGVNLSAINYYFGSRINVLVTIQQTRGAEIEQARNEHLQQAAQRDPPELREIVHAVMTPLARWRRSMAGSRGTARSSTCCSARCRRWRGRRSAGDSTS